MCKECYSKVTILDCASHTWSEAPSLPVGLCLLSASVIDRKIYVAGHYKDGDSNTIKNSFQVFNTESQCWDTLPSETQGGNGIYRSTLSIDGKFHVLANQEVVVYDPKEGRWDAVAPRLSCLMVSHAYCEIDNVLFFASASLEEFRWYDTKIKFWRKLMGLVGLPKLTGECSVRLGNYGGKMMVFWEERVFNFGPWHYGIRKKKILCAE